MSRSAAAPPARVGRPSPEDVTTSAEAHAQWSRVWNEYATGQRDMDSALAEGALWATRVRELMRRRGR